MPYVIETDIIALNKSLELKQVSIPETYIDTYDIRKVDIGDKFFFYLVDEKEILGPYKITSKAFLVQNPGDNLWHTSKTTFNKSVNSFRFFFVTDDISDKHRVALKHSPPFYFKEEEIDYFIQKHINENYDESICVLLIEDYNPEFKFSLIRSGRIITLKKKLSNSWMKDLIKAQEKTINLYSEGLEEDSYKALMNLGEVVYSLLIKGHEDFWKNLADTVIVYPQGKAQFIPFNVAVIENEKFLISIKSLIYSFIDNINAVSVKKTIKNFLIIADPTGTIKSAQKEAMDIFNLLNSSQIKVDIISRDIDLLEIKEFFEKYDVIHFTGHGENGWRIGKKILLTADKIPSLSQAPQLIVSNSCRTALYSNNSGFIEKLLKNNVNWIIASNLKIPDKNMSDFFLAFYKEVIEGYSIDAAFYITISKYIQQNKCHWHYYKLFNNGTF